MLLNESLADAINKPRLYHQLAPMQIDYDIGFDEDLVRGLAAIGHVVQQMAEDDNGFGSVSAVAHDGVRLSAVMDARRHGSAAFL